MPLKKDDLVVASPVDRDAVVCVVLITFEHGGDTMVVVAPVSLDESSYAPFVVGEESCNFVGVAMERAS